MATRIYRSCDRCEESGVDAPGIQRGPFEGRTLDLCDGCWDEVGKPLMALVADRGVVAVEASAPKATRRARRGPTAAVAVEGAQSPLGADSCPLCGVDTLGLSAHLRRVHGVGLSHVYPSTCPLCGEEFDTGQGATMHGARTHGTRGGAASLFAAAEAAGDPHGIVARQRARWRDLA